MEMERQGHDTRESYDRMAQVMERLNQNLGRGYPRVAYRRPGGGPQEEVERGDWLL